MIEVLISLLLYKYGRARSWGIFFNINKRQSFTFFGISISAEWESMAFIGIALGKVNAYSLVGISAAKEDAFSVFGISFSKLKAITIFGISLSLDTAVSFFGLAFSKNKVSQERYTMKDDKEYPRSFIGFSANEARLFWINVSSLWLLIIEFFIGKKE